MVVVMDIIDEIFLYTYLQESESMLTGGNECVTLYDFNDNVFLVTFLNTARWS